MTNEQQAIFDQMQYDAVMLSGLIEGALHMFQDRTLKGATEAALVISHDWMKKLLADMERIECAK